MRNPRDHEQSPAPGRPRVLPPPRLRTDQRALHEETPAAPVNLRRVSRVQRACAHKPRLCPCPSHCPPSSLQRQSQPSRVVLLLRKPPPTSTVSGRPSCATAQTYAAHLPSFTKARPGAERSPA